MCGRVVHKLGQGAVQHALAKRLLQRAAAAGGNQLLAGGGIHMLEHTVAVADFGDKNHFHTKVFTQIVQHLTYVFVNQVIAFVSCCQQQFADIDFQGFWCVVPSVNCHRFILNLPFHRQR